MAEADGEQSPDALLAELGGELARAVPPALEAWVVGRAGQVLRAWADSGIGERAVVDELAGRLTSVAREAAVRAETALAELASTDVDAQSVTPLQIVRSAMAGPTQSLQQAGVAAVVRDVFAEERFPDDLYGLHPSSLAAMSEDLGPLGLAWGAAKAAAHRARHVAGSAG